MNFTTRHPLSCFLIVVLCFTFAKAQSQPNILLIIADDLGVDPLRGYHDREMMAITPTLDSLRANGITFENTFGTPKCTPSRATIMSGLHGIKTGVQGTPGNLDLQYTSLFKAVEDNTNNAYADAAIGKWHISQPVSNDHPLDHGADYYMGFMGSGPEDYYEWTKTEDGGNSTETTYVTTLFTDASLDWIDDQTKPWLLYLAHAAPHTPYHVPPAGTYSIENTTGNARKYIAMIESMDYSINQLLQSMDPEVLANTVIIFIGDNGTPGPQLQDYPEGHGKSTLYQGGIRVPMIISGAGVTRKGERESALVNATDLYATIIEIAGAELPGGVNNSLSFKHLLSDDQGSERDFNYVDFVTNDLEGWASRDDQYKLITYDDGREEFYDLLQDSLEFNNLLLTTLDAEQVAIKDKLSQESIIRRDGWSCTDQIQNGDESGIDCGGSNCAPCTSSTSTMDKSTGITVYPNPATDYIEINSATSRINRVDIYTESGKLILSKTPENPLQTNINVQGISSQVLMVKVQYQDKTETFKVIKG